MKITLPEFSLVVLVGVTGSGKSTFARKHFKPTETLSSDYCRGLVSDDENDQSATKDAFDVLHYIASRRLANKRLTVIDATNVQPEARKPLVSIAREYHCLPVAIIINIPERICHERNKKRPDRDFGPHVIRNQSSQLKRALRGLKREGFRQIHILNNPEEVGATTIERKPLWNDKRNEHGPFDIIGDIHGCTTELEILLEKLGYTYEEKDCEACTYHRLYFHPEGRKVVFLGDLVDRGPRNLDSYQLVSHMVAADNALCVPGNHDAKLLKKLKGKNVQLRHGLEQTIKEFEALPENIVEPFKEKLSAFIDSLVSHYVLDDGKLVVAHGGLKEELQGRASGRVREFALYGETTGETDEFGLPIRYNWAADYRGRALVVYGHTPVPKAIWLNRTINIDTGCVFGGKLTALRYPERELVEVVAEREYSKPTRPLVAPTSNRDPNLLDLEDVYGKRIVNTRLRVNITVRAENSAPALEVMSRFSVNSRWLIYLPPTMSAPETSSLEGWLEHPKEVFDYYHSQGIEEVICEEKHMGSRAVIILCKNEEATLKQFGIEGFLGCCYTRTGRPFFNDLAIEKVLLKQLRDALNESGFWKDFNTDWLCLDCELMPWSAKAQSLLKDQYAAVGAASRLAFKHTLKALEQAAENGADIKELQSRYQERARMASNYTNAYSHYCWPVNGLSDLKLAPFHIMATEGVAHIDKTHLWHLENIKRYLAKASCFLATNYLQVSLNDDDKVAKAINWWEEMTAKGGEGMVVKPLDFISKGKHGLVQPAVKVRGKEYLRIIYGPEYDLPEHLKRLRHRNVSAKRSLALREFALGIEALERFVKNEPHYRVHEAVFAVLALESEPIDPRL